MAGKEPMDAINGPQRWHGEAMSQPAAFGRPGPKRLGQPLEVEQLGVGEV